MIDVPERNFLGPDTISPIRMEGLADWLEANLLFCDPVVSASDVAGELLRSLSVTEGQDRANEIVSAGWLEVRRRQSRSGKLWAVSVTNARLEAQSGWEESPIWSFFVLLSVQTMFPKWANQHGDYPTQGELFEKVVEEICPAIFPGWCSYRTGWASDNTKDIPAIVGELSGRLNVFGHPELTNWIDPAEKDGGLDIVCYRRFDDEREGLPAYFLQCASGRNWHTKVGTPNPQEWQKYMDSAIMPSKGIAAPFVIDKKQLRKSALQGQVAVLDSLRLLSAATNGGVELSADLRDEVVEWMRPRIECLPRLDAG